MTPTPPIPPHSPANAAADTTAGNTARSRLEHKPDEASFGNSSRRPLRGWRKLLLPALLALGLIPVAASIETQSSAHQTDAATAEKLFDQSHEEIRDNLFLKKKPPAEKTGEERLFEESRQSMRDHLFLEEEKDK